MKIRKMTKEELSTIKVTHYDSGFSIWMIMPGLEGERLLLDASTLTESGEITIVSPNNEGYKFGTMYTDNKITLIATE